MIAVIIIAITEIAAPKLWSPPVSAKYDLFYYFMLRPERVFQKTTLAENVWGDHIEMADNLDFIYSQIKNLRKKLKEANADADLQAVYGVGYKLI